MKILARNEFLKLSTVLFAKGSPHIYEGLCLKRETLYDNDGNGNDFYYINLNVVESNSSDELVDRMEDMVNKGSSFPMNLDQSRDGTFCKSDMFLVYEISDIVLLFGKLLSVARYYEWIDQKTKENV